MLNDQNPTDEHKLTPPTPSTGYSVTSFTPQQEGASPWKVQAFISSIMHRACGAGGHPTFPHQGHQMGQVLHLHVAYGQGVTFYTHMRPHCPSLSHHPGFELDDAHGLDDAEDAGLPCLQTYSSWRNCSATPWP